MNSQKQTPLESFNFSSINRDNFEKLKSQKITEYKEKYRHTYCRYLAEFDRWTGEYFGQIDIFPHKPRMPSHSPSELLFFGRD